MGKKVMPEVEAEQAALRSKQTPALAVLLEGGSVREAAEAAGVAPKTVYAWLRTPEFRACLVQVQKATIEHASRRLAQLAHQATEALQKVLTDNETPPNVRVKAAEAVLSRLSDLYNLARDEERAVEYGPDFPRMGRPLSWKDALAYLEESDPENWKL